MVQRRLLLHDITDMEINQFFEKEIRQYSEIDAEKNMETSGNSLSSNLASNVNIFVGPNANPDNANNGFNPLVIGQSDSQLTNSVRDIATIQSGILLPNVNEGFDYGKLENAKKLNNGSDYTVNTQLGYISLNQKLDNDEILAVAFQYSVGGQVYQVGEFANDGIDATSLSNQSGQQQISNNSLILKLLKSSITNVNQPIWDLMMKNIYSLGSQINKEDFKLNIYYSNPSPLNYIQPVDQSSWPENINGKTLLSLFNLDNLNMNNDVQKGGDGFFDFVSNVTSRSGELDLSSPFVLSPISRDFRILFLSKSDISTLSISG